MKFHIILIKDFSFLTEDAVKINFDIPELLKNKFVFNSGQFISIKLKINNEYFIREYSICSSPNEKELSILIKKKNNGIVSNFITKNIQNIKFLEITPPKGNFTILDKPNEKRTLVFFASGSGITPIISIIKHILSIEKNSNIFLFFGNKSKEKTIFHNELIELKSKYTDNFNLYFIYSQQKTEPLFQGRLDSKKLKLYINQILEWDEIDEIFICGPENMIRELALYSFNHGIPQKNIHFELFIPIYKPIFPSKLTKTLFKEVNVEFVFKNKINKIVWKTDQNSLLDSLLNEGFKVPYSCKGGICNSCICKINKGKLILEDNETLTDLELKNNFSLICVAKPASKNISLNFDYIN